MSQRIQYSSHTKEISGSQGMAFWVYCMSACFGYALPENLLYGIKMERGVILDRRYFQI